MVFRVHCTPVRLTGAQLHVDTEEKGGRFGVSSCHDSETGVPSGHNATDNVTT